MKPLPVWKLSSSPRQRRPEYRTGSELARCPFHIPKLRKKNPQKQPKVVHNSTGTLVRFSTGTWCTIQPA